MDTFVYTASIKRSTSIIWLRSNFVFDVVIFKKTCISINIITYNSECDETFYMIELKGKNVIEIINNSGELYLHVTGF